jgi:PPM family protein phosphatase
MKFAWLKRLHQTEPVGEVPPAPAHPGEPLLLDADLLSDVGCVRTNNEDNGRLLRDPAPGRTHHRLLAVVADGMGGHNAGEVASALAIEVMEAAFPKLLTHPAQRLQQAMTAANERIYTESDQNAERNGMGTTCTALLVQDNQAYSAHVGDSRLYLLRNGEMYLVTEDHSQVFEMVKAGVLTLHEARHHPDKNVITRALGRQPHVEVAIWPQPMPVQAGDAFLLCSDGLCDVLEDEEINSVASAHTAADACEELVRLAKSRNAPDNITVAIVKLLPTMKAQGTAAEQEPALSEHTNGSRPTRRVEMHA